MESRSRVQESFAKALKTYCLDLHEYEFTLEELPVITGFLDANPQVVSFTFECFDLKEKPLVAMCDYLKTNQSIKYLSFANYNLTEVGFTAFLDVLRTNKNLQRIGLWNDGRSTITNVLQSNRFKAAVAENPGLAFTNAAQYHALRFDSPAPQPAVVARFVSECSEAIDTKCLNLHECDFSSADLPFLTKFLDKHPEVTTLIFECFQLQEEPLIKMLEFLKTNTSITALAFNHHELKPAGFEAFVNMLQVNKTLKVLHIDQERTLTHHLGYVRANTSGIYSKRDESMLRKFQEVLKGLPDLQLISREQLNEIKITSSRPQQ